MANDSSKIESPYAGWEYYGGDEFNDSSIDLSKWGIYHNNNTFGQPNGMLTYYNESQIKETVDADGNGVLEISSEKTDKEINGHPGWNSGIFNSSGNMPKTNRNNSSLVYTCRRSGEN